MPHVAIVPGFIATDLANGDATNLGRGGSDYTAAILASTLKASALEIWTDVDGFMTADPKVINDAYVIEHLSYVEAMELCNFGAKVIYPPTIFPAYHKNIPIVIQNARKIGNQRIPRLAGGVRKYDLDRRAQRRRGSRDGSAD